MLHTVTARRDNAAHVVNSRMLRSSSVNAASVPTVSTSRTTCSTEGCRPGAVCASDRGCRPGALCVSDQGCRPGALCVRPDAWGYRLGAQGCR